MAHIEKIKGSTFLIVTGKSVLPFYRLDDQRVILMDSGYPDEYEEISQVLDERDLQVAFLLTTHMHFDHVGNHRRFRAKGAKILQSRFDAAVSENFTALGATFYTDTPDELREGYDFMIFGTDECFSQTDEWLTIEHAAFRILDLSGHAHSQTGFVTPDGVAYLGDALFSEFMLKDGGLIFHHNWSAALESLEKIRKLDLDSYVLAHRGVYTDIHDLIDKNEAFLEKMSRTLLDLCDSWMTKEAFQTKVMACMHMRLDSVTKYHIADRICNSAIVYLIEEKKLLTKISDHQLLYIKK